GAAGRRRLSARRYDLAEPDAGPLAMPLLRQYPLGRPARGRDRRPDASRAAVPGAGLVDDFRLGPQAGGPIAQTLPGRGGRHRHVRAADPFSPSDHRTRGGRRRTVPLRVRSVRRLGRSFQTEKLLHGFDRTGGILFLRRVAEVVEYDQLAAGDVAVKAFGVIGRNQTVATAPHGELRKRELADALGEKA